MAVVSPVTQPHQQLPTLYCMPIMQTALAEGFMTVAAQLLKRQPLQIAFYGQIQIAPLATKFMTQEQHQWLVTVMLKVVLGATI